MDEHFRAFSFVDRITSLEPGVRIRGRYVIPSNLEAFPGSLVAEAVGQLAAWAAMSVVNFERRPIAGIAGSIEHLALVRPGQVLELGVDFDSVDAEAAAYSGSAHIGETQVIRLTHCVGPMVLVSDFDDPEALRERFALLCGPGAPAGAFGGLPALAFQRTNGEAGHSVRGTLQVPASAPLFEDHFPRRPVFPGSLLMHVNLQMAATLAAELPPPGDHARWKVRAVSDMKLRAFIPPGELLELVAKLSEQSGDSASVIVESRNGKRVVGAASVLLEAEQLP